MTLGSRGSIALALLGVALLLGVVLLMKPSPPPVGSGQSVPQRSVEVSTTPAVKVPTPKATVASEGPAGSLSIAGSVLNRQGERLVGIELNIEPRFVATNENGQKPTPRGTTSDSAGRYRFDGLTPDDYEIRSGETPLYSSADVTVRAGTDPVNLVLTARRLLRAYGVVKDGDKPLAGVHVVASHEPSNTTVSGSDGRFALYLDGAGQDTLQFSLAGYADQRLPLDRRDPFASELKLGDVRMTRIKGEARVRGSVTANSSPVAEARVFLRATDDSTHYETTSDAGGSFALPRVALGEYTVNVVPQSDYRDYTESGVKIAASGRELRIALTSLAEGAVRGQMVDLNGKPVPGFSLWLTSLQAMAHGSKQVEGDSEGRFEIAGIPTGHQQFATLAIPNIRVSGITVNDTSDPPLRLTLDVGEYMLEGQVRDSYSNAVAGAEVSLTWSYESNGIASHAARDTTTDSGGHFRFSQLGPGAHTLEVNASGYQQQRIEQDVGVRATVQIELRALAR